MTPDMALDPPLLMVLTGEKLFRNLIAPHSLGPGILSEMGQDKYSVLRTAMGSCSDLAISGKEGNIFAILGAVKEE